MLKPSERILELLSQRPGEFEHALLRFLDEYDIQLREFIKRESHSAAWAMAPDTSGRF